MDVADLFGGGERIVALVEILYTAVVVALAFYGLNALWLTLVALWKRPQRSTPLPVAEWPRVTVQLPIYNELHVATRLLRAVARFDYPRERLEIQVLDDSDDETSLLLQRAVTRLRQQGVDVHYVRRARRDGYKAGALAYGLARARGDLIALFDADFVPPADWLRRTVAYLVHNPRLGFVQTRWEHLNASASPITLAQSLALDGHFAVEQAARQALGWPVTFNGSAGVWRRACIEESGGWQADTLCEDLDLAYRAQMRGWQGRVLLDVAAAGEIPPLVSAFRRQQARWATGSIQSLRKHALDLLRASHLPWMARIQGIVHMSSYMVHPLMIALLLLTPLMIFAHRQTAWPLTYLSVAGLGPPLAYALAQLRLRGHLRRFVALPLMIFLGLGIAWEGTRAVWRGFRSRETPFERTPKFRLEGADNGWQGKRYGELAHRYTVGEWIFGLYALIMAVVAWREGHLGAVPFMALYALSFLTVAITSGWQARQQRKARLRALSHPASAEAA